MQPLSPSTSQIRGGREYIGTDFQVDEAGRLLWGRVGRWAGVSGSPWEPGPKGTAVLQRSWVSSLDPHQKRGLRIPPALPDPPAVLSEGSGRALSWGLCVSDVLVA